MVVVAASLLAILAVFGLLLYSATHVVEEGEVEAVYVAGELQAVVDTGVYFYPPLISTTYPVDPDTMRIRTHDGDEPVPPEFQPVVRRVRDD